MKKSIICLIVVFCLLTCLCACKKKVEVTVKTTSTTEDVAGSTDDNATSSESYWNVTGNMPTRSDDDAPTYDYSSYSNALRAPTAYEDSYSTRANTTTNPNSRNTLPSMPPPPAHDSGNNYPTQNNDVAHRLELSDLSIEYATRKRAIDNQYYSDRTANATAVSDARAKIYQYENQITRLQNDKSSTKQQYDNKISDAYTNSGGQESSYVMTLKRERDSALQNIDSQIDNCNYLISKQSKIVQDLTSGASAEAKRDQAMAELNAWNESETRKINSKYGK